MILIRKETHPWLFSLLGHIDRKDRKGIFWVKSEYQTQLDLFEDVLVKAERLQPLSIYSEHFRCYIDEQGLLDFLEDFVSGSNKTEKGLGSSLKRALEEERLRCERLYKNTQTKEFKGII